MKTREIVATIDLEGQPDSIAVSPDKCWAAVCIENERNEDINDEQPGQLPAGFLQVIHLSGKPSTWEACKVELTDLADDDRFPEDPEPEFVSINSVATRRSSRSRRTTTSSSSTSRTRKSSNDFSAGGVDLEDIDTDRGRPDSCSPNSQDDRLREPDAVKWINNKYFVTANEGDLDGGSRGFTIFTKKGKVAVRVLRRRFEHLGVRTGHYPEGRSEQQGHRARGCRGRHVLGNGITYLFVGSERGNYVNGVRAARSQEASGLQADPALHERPRGPARAVEARRVRCRLRGGRRGRGHPLDRADLHAASRRNSTYPSIYSGND